VSVCLLLSHHFIFTSFSHHFNISHFQSRADAAEETVKALSEIMKEKDKEIETANVRKTRRKEIPFFISIL
jgi:hypothetical protein